MNQAVLHAEGAMRVAMAYVAIAFGAGVEDTFRANYENLGGTITAAIGARLCRI